MRSKEVEFSSIGVTKVYVPPTIRVSQIVERAHPLPQAPVVVEKAAAGKTISMVILDDPEYLRQKEEVQAARNQLRDELHVLFCLRDVVVPEGWFVDDQTQDVIRLANPEWKPRDGANGHKLDYIEWHVLYDPMDESKYITTVTELMGISQEDVALVEASFRDQVDGPAA